MLIFAIDDEPKARSLLERTVREAAPQSEVIAFSDGLNDNGVSRVLGICLLESSNLFLGKFNNILGNPDLDLSCCLATSCKRCKRCSYESRTEYKTK